MAIAVGLVLTATQTLLSAMQTKDLRDVCSMFGYESKLEELKATVEIIQAVLRDAEYKQQELSFLGNIWVRELKDAIYDADDLFDEFNTTVALQKKQMPGGKVSEKVRLFFSSDNQLLFAAKTTRKIKKLRAKLDSIARDRTQFGFGDVHVPVKKREETSSYVYESSIIGRGADKEDVLGLLSLDDDSGVVHNVSFVSIVGIGGLGKTALAQLVFNDERIKSAFELTLWVCVSEEFGMKEILLKMLGKDTSELNKEELQKEVRRKIEGKRYFLVLDDVWNESCNRWEEIRNFFLIGAKGSRIVVTTRSKLVATAIGDHLVHELEGLSDEDSWCLFKRVAFKQEIEQEVVDDFVDLGKHIVKKCANVPLSIKVIGSMLRDQHKSKWEQFQELDLAKMSQGEDGIMPILKFSYYHLTPQLKSCFSYCALFPKDHLIKKALLIDLWLAQGFPECPNDMQRIEDVGEEYFSTLLHRSFFQDIEKDEYGDIVTVKMHDLIHDLAQEVAGQESCLVKDDRTSHFDDNIRHLSDAYPGDFSLCLSNAPNKLRTLRMFLRPMYASYLKNDVVELVLNCRRLRVLDLYSMPNTIKSLPKTLLNLSHLRCLDLSYNNYLEMLPKSISKLHNLQVLNLSYCYSLEELPEDLRELVNLRHLHIVECKRLTHMPAGMGSLTGLTRLTMFVLGGRSSNQMQIGHLRDLIPLVNLRGELTILFKKGCSNDVVNAEEGSYLSNKKYIKCVKLGKELKFNVKLRHDEAIIMNERLLEALKPHRDIREINIGGYKDLRLPSWAVTLASSFPLLVKVNLSCFNELEHLPRLSQLKHLKSLKLSGMLNVEYMEDDNNGAILPFYPSLEKLSLIDFPKLKGWWREVGVEREATLSGVLKLKIIKCPNLTSFPEFPKLKVVNLQNFNDALTFCAGQNPITSSDDLVYCLDKLTIDNVGSLNSLFGETLQGIYELIIESAEVQNLSTIAEWYLKHASSIKSLKFSNCNIPMSLSVLGIEHMSNLENLSISSCKKLDEGDDDGMPWRALRNLSSLSLWDLPKAVNLPKGIQYMYSLKILYINSCDSLDNLPEWLHRLTSLQYLELSWCPRLKSLPEAGLPNLTSLTITNCSYELVERCRKPDGEDWPKIRHIPSVYLVERDEGLKSIFGWS